jgi:hypothetical protein
MNDQRRKHLVAALGFLQLKPIEPELRMLHRWLDSWTGVGLITVGVERQGLRLSLSHVTRGRAPGVTIHAIAPIRSVQRRGASANPASPFPIRQPVFQP